MLVAAAIALGRAVGRGYIGVLIDARGRYSLTQLQIVLWTLVVISLISGVFWARLLDDADTALTFGIPAELLAVLGISVGSTVAATVVKSQKDEQRPEHIAASDATKEPSFKQVFTIEEGGVRRPRDRRDQVPELLVHGHPDHRVHRTLRRTVQRPQQHRRTYEPAGISTPTSSPCLASVTPDTSPASFPTAPALPMHPARAGSTLE